MGKFSRFPNKESDLAGKEEAIEEFIRGAGSKTTTTNSEENIWTLLDDTEKSKGINLRITKADLAKLQHISKNTPYSIQGFCYEAVKKAIEDKLDGIV